MTALRASAQSPIADAPEGRELAAGKGQQLRGAEGLTDQSSADEAAWQKRREDHQVVSRTDEYKETLESIRHFSRLRFAQLAVFSGLNAALIYTFFRADAAQSAPATKILVAVAGLAFSVIFFWMEAVHDAYKSSFIRLAVELSPDGHWARRPKQLAMLIRIPVWGTYVIPFFFWIYLLVA